MVLSIDILPQTEERLRRQAEAAGKDVDQYVLEIITEATSKPVLDEILLPLRQQFAKMGIDDAELVEDITKAQAEYRVQRFKKAT